MAESNFKRKAMIIDDEDELPKKLIDTPSKTTSKPQNLQNKLNSSEKSKINPIHSTPKKIDENRINSEKSKFQDSKNTKEKTESNITKTNNSNSKESVKKPSQEINQKLLKKPENDKQTINNNKLKNHNPQSNSTNKSSNGNNKPKKSKSSSSNSSSSDSDSSSSSSSSGSSSNSVSSRKKIKKVARKKKVLKPKTSNKVLLGKKSLVLQFLKRWWFAYDWPNKENYDEELKKHNLRKVEVSEWKLEPDVDEKGNSKCIELSGFKGVFRDFKGALHDFRPKDMCPSINNFMKKDEKYIYELLIKALKKQINDLKTGEKYSNEDHLVVRNLEKELEIVLSNYKKLNK